MTAKSKTQDVLAKIVEILVREYQPEKIVLFGSYAYGTPDEESDIDLLIVKKTAKSFFQRLFEVQQLVSEIRRGYAFDPIVFSPAEIENRLEIGDHFIEEILEKGIVIYGNCSPSSANVTTNFRSKTLGLPEIKRIDVQ
jgi:predicted nucleotidyltransferase